jgi:hypothetical protein
MKKALIIFIVSFCSFVYPNEQKSDHSLWDELLQKNVDNQGNVNYKGFLKDRQILKKYLDHLSQNPPKEHWSKNEKLAYYINAYNAFTVELILENYPLKSIKDLRRPWKRKFIPIGNELLSLDDIEHGILRNLNEPRIHFAVNCASVSCPKLYNKAFTAKQLESQLDKLTREFINSSENRISENQLQLSKIFQWYEQDYLVNGIRSLAHYVSQYTDVKINPKARVSFLDYNWDLNEKK